MSEEKSLFIGKLQLIKQFRSIGFISEKLDVTVSMVREWFDGDIENDLLQVVDELIDKEFEEEIQLSIDDESLIRLKDDLKNDIVLIETKLNTSDTLKVLGGISLATFNRYKKGEIPLSNILYLRDTINDILKKLTTNLNSNDKLKESIEKQKNKVSSLNVIKNDLSEIKEVKEVKEVNEIKEVKEVNVDKEVNTKSTVKNKGDVNKVSNNMSITKHLFSGVEKELKEKFGDDIELKKIEFVEDKIIIEAGLKDD